MIFRPGLGNCNLERGAVDFETRTSLLWIRYFKFRVERGEIWKVVVDRPTVRYFPRLR